MKATIIYIMEFLLSACLWAENIDPYNTDMQYAWGENAGRLNFEPNLFVTGAL